VDANKEHRQQLNHLNMVVAHYHVVLLWLAVIGLVEVGVHYYRLSVQLSALA
jgi:hypothetical protein